MSTQEEGEVPPRDAKWDGDGIGVHGDGSIVVKLGPTIHGRYSPEYLRETLMGRIDMERQIEELRRQVNAREPNGIIPWILIELEGRARKADKNREAGCGSTFSGISYGLRDAIALIRSKFE